MNFPNDLSKDIQSALRLIHRAFPETDEQFEAFIAEVDSGNIPVPETPAHLSPTSLVDMLREERKTGTMPSVAKILPFPSGSMGLSGLRIAARNGNGALSEETLQRMEDAQEE
jgi:hypothetical protein